MRLLLCSAGTRPPAHLLTHPSFPTYSPTTLPGAFLTQGKILTGGPFASWAGMMGKWCSRTHPDAFRK